MGRETKDTKAPMALPSGKVAFRRRNSQRAIRAFLAGRHQAQPPSPAADAARNAIRRRQLQYVKTGTRSLRIAYALLLIGFVFALHRFYIRSYVRGAVQLAGSITAMRQLAQAEYDLGFLILGGMAVWWIADAVRLPRLLRHYDGG